MPIAQIIAALTQLLAEVPSLVPMFQRWKDDLSVLKQIQEEKGVDYVPVAEDFAVYDERSRIAENQIDANADRARQP